MKLGRLIPEVDRGRCTHVIPRSDAQVTRTNPHNASQSSFLATPGIIPLWHETGRHSNSPASATFKNLGPSFIEFRKASRKTYPFASTYVVSFRLRHPLCLAADFGSLERSTAVDFARFHHYGSVQNDSSTLSCALISCLFLLISWPAQHSDLSCGESPTIVIVDKLSRTAVPRWARQMLGNPGLQS